MKVQQRPFVIEYKSSRRRMPTTPSSIWGNANLKELAKDVEEDAPHLFSTDLLPIPAGVIPDILPASATSESTVEQSVKLSHDDEINPSESTSASGAEEAIPAGTTSGVEVVEFRSNRAAKDTKIIQRRVQRRKSSVYKGPAVAVVTAMGVSDDLKALEEENFRLKALLIASLRDENEELRKMLHRFRSEV